MEEKDKIIILFDGTCSLCNGAVNWILRRDRKDTFRFAFLQSGFSERLVVEHSANACFADSLIVFARGQLYERSAAVLQICTGLPQPWSWLRYLAWIPQDTRDTIYDWIARHRYAWFGQRNVCRIPARNEREKFLDDW